MLRLVLRLDPFAALRPGPDSPAPDLHAAAHAALLAGADAVRLSARLTRDAERLGAALAGPLLLDAVPGTPEVDLAVRLRPERVTLVPGPAALPAGAERAAWSGAVERLRGAELPVAVRLPASEEALLAASEAGAAWADLDTRRFAEARGEGARLREFLALSKAAATARQLGLRVTAGGGLTPSLAGRLAGLADVEELHLGFDVLARAVFLGLGAAVAAVRRELLAARALLAPGAGGSA